jgi:hypothetical protein
LAGRTIRILPHDFRPKPGREELALVPSNQEEVSPTNERLLTAEEFHRLKDVRPEAEWFANISNAQTRRAYQNAVSSFPAFLGIQRPEEFRTVTRAHILAWREDLRPVSEQDQKRRQEAGAPVLSPASVRRKLSAQSSLFDCLCGNDAITHNPVKGVERPGEEEGLTREKRQRCPTPKPRRFSMRPPLAV